MKKLMCSQKNAYLLILENLLTIMRYLTDSYLNFHKTILLVTSSQLAFDPNVSKVYLLYKKSQKVSVETLLNAFRVKVLKL